MENEQQQPQQEVPQQNLQPASLPPQPPTSFVVGSNVPKRKKTGLIIAIVTVLLIIAGSGVFAVVKMNQQDTEMQKKSEDTSSQSKNKTTRDDSEDTQDAQMQGVMNSSSARMIQTSIGAFYAGGSSGGVQQSENSYYPSSADMTDQEWVEKNLNLPQTAISALKEGSIVYTAEGCDNTKPSSKSNACSSFTITFKGSTGKTEELKSQI